MARRDFISDSSRTSLACALGVLAVLFRMRDLFPGAIRPSCFLGSSRNDHYGLGAGVVARGEIGAGGEPRRRAARVRPAAFLVRTGKLVQDSFGGGLLTGRVDSSSLAVLASCGLGAALVRDRPYRRMAQHSTWSVSGRRCRAI